MSKLFACFSRRKKCTSAAHSAALAVCVLPAHSGFQLEVGAVITRHWKCADATGLRLLHNIAIELTFSSRARAEQRRSTFS
jgi:hypothetical protein